jgi:hypothetical protein
MISAFTFAIALTTSIAHHLHLRPPSAVSSSRGALKKRKKQSMYVPFFRARSLKSQKQLGFCSSRKKSVVFSDFPCREVPKDVITKSGGKRLWACFVPSNVLVKGFRHVFLSLLKTRNARKRDKKT